MLVYFLLSYRLFLPPSYCGKKQYRHHRSSSSSSTDRMVISTTHTTRAPHLRSIAAFAEITVTKSDHAAGADVPAAVASPPPSRRRFPPAPKNGTAILPSLAPLHSMAP